MLIFNPASPTEEPDRRALTRRLCIEMCNNRKIRSNAFKRA